MASFRVIEISGDDPTSRGRQYGTAATDLIHRALRYYRVAFAEQAGLTWDGVTAHVQPWRELIEHDYPDLAAEMRGIAAGAGVPVDDIVALNARGEIIYDNWNGVHGQDEELDPTDIEGCTSFALTPSATADGHMYVGQNWDWRHAVRDTVVVLHIVQPPKPTVIMQVEAGQIGRHGANSAGIALNANGLGGRFSNESGAPQTILRRAVLDADNVPDALKVLVRTRAHIASNALLSHRSGYVIDLETTPGAVGWQYPDEAGVLVHGNHYQAFVPPQLADEHRPFSHDSLLRVPQARQGLRSAAAAADTAEVREAIRTAMSDHLGHPNSLCAHPDPRDAENRQWSTLLSSCVDLTTGEYLIAAGTPCTTPYESLAFNLYS
jgi:isopenicillin-N N-acyltransferase like protein